jgi:hypothetical protein
MRLATTSMMLSFFLTAMDLKGLLAVRRQRGDARALAGGVAAVEHQDGNVLFDGRQDGGRMQHLGAEVGQLGGLFKADDLDAQRVGADAGVGGHDAVHVGPDLDGLGGERAADEGAGEVGAAAAQGGGDAGLVGGDEAAHDRHLSLRGEREQLFPGARFSMSASCGTAFWNCESVMMISRASTWAASMPSSRKAAATMRLEMRSP